MATEPSRNTLPQWLQRTADEITEAATNRMPLRANNPGRPQEVMDSMIGDISIAAGAESGNAIAVTFQAYDVKGRVLDRRVHMTILVTDTSYAAVPTTELTNASVSTGTIILEHATDAYVDVLSDATGKVVFDLSETLGANTFFVSVTIGDRTFQSAAITFA